MRLSARVALVALAVKCCSAVASRSSPSTSNPAHLESRQVLEGAALIAAAVDLVSQSIIGACFTDCGAWTGAVVIGCSAKALLPDETLEGCVCSMDNLILWRECAQCIVNNLDETTQRPAKMAAIRESYVKSCGASLDLTDVTSSSLPIFTDPGTGIPESLTRTTSSSLASYSPEAHPGRGPPSSSSTTSASISGSISLAPPVQPSPTSSSLNAFTVTSTASMVTSTSYLSGASAAAASASAQPVSESGKLGAGSAMISILGLLMGLLLR